MIPCRDCAEPFEPVPIRFGARVLGMTVRCPKCRARRANLERLRTAGIVKPHPNGKGWRKMPRCPVCDAPIWDAVNRVVLECRCPQDEEWARRDYEQRFSIVETTETKLF